MAGGIAPWMTALLVGLAAIGLFCLWLYRTQRISYHGFTLIVSQLFLGFVVTLTLLLIAKAPPHRAAAQRSRGFPTSAEWGRQLLRRAVVRQVELIASMSGGWPQAHVLRPRMAASEWRAHLTRALPWADREEVRITRRLHGRWPGRPAAWEEHAAVSYRYDASRSSAAGESR